MDTGFPAYATLFKFGILFGWQTQRSNSGGCGMRMGSLVFVRYTWYAVFSVIRKRVSSLWYGAQKNCLRGLWLHTLGLVRPQHATVATRATLALVLFAKMAENATDYPVMKTAPQMMWLPTSREGKYKAKQAADTFIVRTGDLASAGLVFVGTALLEFDLQHFAATNVVLCLVWLAAAILLLKEYRRLAGHHQLSSAAPSTRPG